MNTIRIVIAIVISAACIYYAFIKIQWYNRNYDRSNYLMNGNKIGNEYEEENKETLRKFDSVYNHSTINDSFLRTDSLK